MNRTSGGQASRVAVVAALAVCAGMLSSEVLAAPIERGTTYRLTNHPGGAERDPAYGLRLDGLFGDTSEIVTFDFNDNAGTGVTLSWEGNTIDINGVVYGGVDVGHSFQAPEYYNLNFTYTVDDADVSNGRITAFDGSGALTSQNDPSLSYALGEKSNGSYAFRIEDGHRCAGCLAGWGWLTHDNEYVQYSDFLFVISEPITPFSEAPEPATLALLLAGIAGLGFAARSRPA